MKSTVLTVTQVNTYVRSILEGDQNLSRLMVKGEISNFNRNYKSGHMYFTLKDSNCVIKAVMFNKFAQSLKITPQNGMTVIIGGNLTVYEKDGQYQLVCTDIIRAGEGEANEALKKLKQKLEAEGLFSNERKKPLPKLPKKIAVVTSVTSAALQDIINIVSGRYNLCELVIIPTLMQGEKAAEDVAKSVCLANCLDDIDVIIVARGGGANEDLDPFNNENVVRTIADSPIPIISAVGHQTDFTLSDFAADLRVPTPTAAAEAAVPRQEDIIEALSQIKNRLNAVISAKHAVLASELEYLSHRLTMQKSDKKLDAYLLELAELSSRLNKAICASVERYEQKLSQSCAVLETLSPLKTLSRGYSIVLKDDKTIKSALQLLQNDSVELIFNDGKANAVITATEAQNEYKEK